MVEIHTLSVADFKRTMQGNNLNDCNIEQRKGLAIISIGNSFDDELADDIFRQRTFIPLVQISAQKCSESRL